MASHMSAGLQLFLNGELRTVDNPDPRQTLLDYLRSPEVGLTGAKLSCGEGGCGACTVLLGRWEPSGTALQGWGYRVRKDATGIMAERTVNACLTPLCSVDGMAVTTIEGLCDHARVMHPVARQLIRATARSAATARPVG